jgi:hypothetical protein
MISLSTVIIYSGLSAGAVMLLLWKLGKKWFRRALGFEVAIDLAFTFHMFTMMGFTFSGLITAIVAGFIFSVMLRIAKNFFGSEVPNIKNGSLVWEFTPGEWRAA